MVGAAFGKLDHRELVSGIPNVAGRAVGCGLGEHIAVCIPGVGRRIGAAGG